MRTFFLFSFFLLERKRKRKRKSEEPICLTFVYFWGVMFGSPFFFFLPFRCNFFFTSSVLHSLSYPLASLHESHICRRDKTEKYCICISRSRRKKEKKVYNYFPLLSRTSAPISSTRTLLTEGIDFITLEGPVERFVINPET